MRTLRYTSGTKVRLVFLALLIITALLMPSGAKAAERDGTVLFFSLEDLQHVLARPSFSSFASFLLPSQSLPSSAWRAQSWAAEQNSPLGRNDRYGNRFWADGYRLPGPHPLWGY